MQLIKKLFLCFTCSSFMGLATYITPVCAESTDASDGSTQIAEINKIMESIKKNSGVDDISSGFDDTASLFSSLSSTYSKLSNNYGNITTASAGDYYMDYLQNLQDANESTGYDDKLYAIQNSDISINDATLNSTYAKLKKKVKSNLSSAGIDVSDSTTSKNKSTAKKNTANRETLTSFSNSSAKYEELVDNYKSLLTSEDEDGNTIENPYASQTKSKLTQSLGKTISQSYYDGDTYSGSSFISTSQLYSKINSAVNQLKNSSDSSSSDNSENKTYSSISSGIKGGN